MNLRRVAVPALAAWVVAIVYAAVVNNILLRSELIRYPGVYRSAHQAAANLPFTLVGSLLAMVVATIIYSRGYAGGSGFAEGARFGTLLGLYGDGVWFSLYASLNIGGRLALYGCLVTFGQALLIGVVIGLTYAAPRPSMSKVAAAHA